MAKSLRSKWKRRMRAEKRVRYGEREHKKLVKMVEAAEEMKKKDGDDSTMNNVEQKEENITEADSMDISVKSKFSSSSLKDEHGNYPAWMSKRKMAKLGKKTKPKKFAPKKGKVTKKR